MSRRWIRIEPPPISLPLHTMSYAYASADPGSVSKVSSESGFGEVNAWWTAVQAPCPTADVPGGLGVDASARTAARRRPTRTTRHPHRSARHRRPISSRVAPSSDWAAARPPAAKNTHRPARRRRPWRGRRARSEMFLATGPAQLAVVGDAARRPAPRCPALLGPLLPGVKLRRGAAAPPRHARPRRRTGPGRPGTASGRSNSVRSVISQAEPQVRLVGAVPLHGLGEGHPRERRAATSWPTSRQIAAMTASVERDDVVLVDEAHLDVELGELRLPVGAEVLVAVAAGDLVVALHPGHHEQLLEQLRALRQRVPGAGTQSRRHQEVAGALRVWTGSGSASRSRRTRARRATVRAARLTSLRSRIALPAGSAQVEIAVLEPGLLAGRWRGRRSGTAAGPTG